MQSRMDQTVQPLNAFTSVVGLKLGDGSSSGHKSWPSDTRVGISIHKWVETVYFNLLINVSLSVNFYMQGFLSMV